MTTMRSATAAAESEQSIVAEAEIRARMLTEKYRGADTRQLLAAMIKEQYAGRIALVSSFGAEAAVLLHMISDIDPDTPVIFVNSGKLFGETLRYRDQLVERLGLADVRTVSPEPERVEQVDPDGVLWYGNPNMCCYIRKVEPLQRAVEGLDAWITGRKGFQGGQREGLAVIEAGDDGRIKINPLAGWEKDRLDAYFADHDLPRHPLEADGFLSIGCMPCTDRVAPGEDARAGRWRGKSKTECGIHLPRANWKVMGID